MDLGLNKRCFTFLLSAQFHFSFYRLFHGTHLRADTHHHPPAHTTHPAGANKHTCLLGARDQCCISLPLVHFSGVHMFRTTILYLQETNKKQTRWSDFWCLQAWIAILLWIAISLIKGKLKSQFIQFPNLNSFHFSPGYCNLKSQTNRSKHRSSGFCFCFYFCP